MAKTASQKKARALLDSLPHIYMKPMNTNMGADKRCYIGNDLYINVTCFNTSQALDRLRRLAKRKGWRPSDLFPASVSGQDYGAVTHLVRIGALESISREELKKALYSEEDMKWYGDRIDKVMTAVHEPWPEIDPEYTSAYWTGKNKAMTDEECAKAIETLKERNKLVYAKEEIPDIETCIRVLKEAGYKIMKPVTEYQEV